MWAPGIPGAAGGQAVTPLVPPLRVAIGDFPKVFAPAAEHS